MNSDSLYEFLSASSCLKANPILQFLPLFHGSHSLSLTPTLTTFLPCHPSLFSRPLARLSECNTWRWRKNKPSPRRPALEICCWLQWMGINLGPLVTRNAPLTLSCLCCGRNGCSTGVGGDFVASLWKYSVEKYKNCRTASRVQGRFKTWLWFALHGHDRMGRKGHEIYMLHRHTHTLSWTWMPVFTSNSNRPLDH